MTTVALCGRDPIRLWVGLPLSPIGKISGHAWRHWHVLDENEYTRPNIAVSETTFLGVLMQRCSSCKGSRSRGDSKVPLGITPPLVACACSEITLSVTKYSQDHRASFRLVQGRPGCGCCVATERATPTITISAKVVLKMQLKCSPERECNYTNRLMGHY